MVLVELEGRRLLYDFDLGTVFQAGLTGNDYLGAVLDTRDKFVARIHVTSQLHLIERYLPVFIDIDKTVPEYRHRSHCLRPCQGRCPAERGQQTRLCAMT